jgi:hypothetical protein
MTADAPRLSGVAGDGGARPSRGTRAGLPAGLPVGGRAGRRVAGAIRAAVVVLAVTAAGALTCWLAGRTVTAVWGERQGPWILGRSAGLTSYGLLVLLTLLGLFLSHPWRTRSTWPSTITRVRLHAGLGFTVLHVVVLALDSYAGVGWSGALLPMAATYRPAPVTLGLFGAYAGVFAGLTAALAGRVRARIWWPVHKVAGSVFVLVWLHGLLAGSDSTGLRGMYVGTGILVAVVALSRYTATTPADRAAELRVERAEPVERAEWVERAERARR